MWKYIMYNTGRTPLSPLVDKMETLLYFDLKTFINLHLNIQKQTPDEAFCAERLHIVLFDSYT